MHTQARIYFMRDSNEHLPAKYTYKYINVHTGIIYTYIYVLWVVYLPGP